DIPQYGYTGREPDVAGLIYYRARWYDPSIGRFTQRDPSGLAGGLNPYAYVDGDPINLIDPSGLTSAKPQPVRQTSYVNSPLAVQPGKQMLTSMMANFEARQAQDSQAALDRAQSAADHWAQKQQETGNPLYAIPGTVASALANPDTMDKLGLILAAKGAKGAKKSAIGSPTAGKPVDSATRERILARDRNPDGSWTCATCGQKTNNPANVHTGHITPRSRGGDLSDGNLRCEGAACNLSQGNRNAPSLGMTCAERGSCGAPYGRTD
uniref:RHS repeat-associated core domain-containing protein n=1 Tax=Chitinivorax sp. B TaxID=2502235 RepID=UPI0010F62F92